MAAEIELKRINEYVSNLVAVTSITGAYVYGIDSNGNSIKIAVSTIAGAGTDYSQQIEELTRKCNNNTTLITALQSAVNGKAAASHTHAQSDITGLTAALEGKAAASHTHAQSDITGLTTALNGKADSVHSHQQSDISGLSDALAGKAAANHTHQISAVQGLQDALEGKAAANHTHAISQVNGLQDALSDINTTVGGLNTTVNGLNTTVNTLNGTVTTLGNNVADMQGDVENLDDRVDTAEEDIETLEERINQIRNQTDTTYCVKARNPLFANTIPEYEGQIVQGRETEQGQTAGYFYKNQNGWLYQGDRFMQLYQISNDDHYYFLCPHYQNSYLEDYDVKSKKFAAIANNGIYYFFSFPRVVPTLADIEFLEHNLCVPYTAEYDTDYDVPTWSGNYYDFADGDPATFTYEQVDGGYRILTVTFADRDGNDMTFNIPDTDDTTAGWLYYNKATGEKYYSGGGAHGQDYFFASQDIVAGYVVPTSPVGVPFNYMARLQVYTDDDAPIGSPLWERVDVQPPTNVADGDNFLTLTNDAIGSTIAITYNSTNQHLELKGNGGAVVSYVDMSEFIVDGMLDNVEYYTTAEQGVTVQVPYLKFTFNTDSGKSDIRISLHDLVDIYDGANINLTSAFVKAATYSAPAIGDSMDVAIGKLLKGHEDNATALAQKATSTQGGYADTALQNVTASGSGYVTLTAAAKTGNNGAKTQAISASLTMQALATADAQHQGLAEASDVKVALQTVAAGGLKCVDLTTYQGGTDGDIVKHIGATTAQYVNGYDYKKVGNSTVYPSDTLVYSFGNIVPSLQDDADLFASIRDKNFFKTSDSVTIYEDNGGSACLYLGNKSIVEVGDTLYVQPNLVYNVSTVNSASYPYDIRYWNDNYGLEVTESFQSKIYRNADGVEIILYTYVVNEEFVKEHPMTETNFPIMLLSGNKLHLGIADTAWIGCSDDVTPPPSWQQWDAQPPVDISGKQDTITGAASTITTADLTASKALISDANGKVAASSVTATELGYLAGSTSNIQTQIDTKRVYFGTSNTSASTAIKEITTDADFPTVTVNNEVVPMTGVMICIKPSISDSGRSEQLKLKVNNCKEFPIWYNGAAFSYLESAISSRVFSANRIFTYVFNGSYWVWVSNNVDADTTYSAMSVAEGTAGTATSSRVVRADYLQQIIHGQIDKFVGTRAMTEDAYWDLVTAGTVQADTLYITYDNDWEG